MQCGLILEGAEVVTPEESGFLFVLCHLLHTWITRTKVSPVFFHRVSRNQEDSWKSFKLTLFPPVHLVTPHSRYRPEPLYRDPEKEITLSVNGRFILFELPGRGRDWELRKRSSVNALWYTQSRGSRDAGRHARTRARTHALPYSCRCGRSRVYQQRRPPHQDAAGLSVIGREFGSPGERAGAGRERMVKLTAGDRRRMGSGGGFRSA